MKKRPDTDLRGRFLLAMPGMGDPRFERSVIYVMAHDAEGAMGFIINQPAKGLTLGDIAQNLPQSVADTGLVNMPVFIGGPVQNDTGFVLYSRDETPADELPVDITQSLEILINAAQARGPQHIKLILGYAGWGQGQLEGELQENAWLICPATLKDVFSATPEKIYQTCITRLGIDLALLSQDGGEA